MRAVAPGRVTGNPGSPANHTFVYPRSAADPPADRVRQSFRITADGFQSELGRVGGTTYVGRTSAGGEGTGIDCHGDGVVDASFDPSCRFVLQLDRGRIVAVEADRKVTATIRGKPLRLEPFVPVRLDRVAGARSATSHPVR